MASYAHLFTFRRLWLILTLSVVAMFSVLLFFGREIYHAAPPIPAAVRTTTGTTVYTREDIQRGQAVWQAMGGMQQGSIWGHGGYLAPDWSADWLHREATAQLDARARADGAASFAALDTRTKAAEQAVLRVDMRRNTYDPATQVISISPDRAAAVALVQAHYRDLYQARTPEARELRVKYAFPTHTRLSDADAHALSAFYFWTAWATTTERPGKSITYTSNWPHEPLVGNTPTGAVFLWSMISIIVLLAGIGAIVAYYAREFDAWRADSEPDGGFAATDFMDRVVLTPSMLAVRKYFWVVMALFSAQVLLGIITAHYQVEGQGLYGLPFSDMLPYAVTRTWHTQLAVLWIATAWLATGLYVAPLLTGHEPRFQVWGVNFLFVSLLVIVVGAFAGQWAAVNGFFHDLTANFWFGHQGYEYTDFGRFWQIYLFIGLLLWVGLVLRSLWPALRGQGGVSLVLLVAVSAVSIGLLFGASLMWGQKTHISIMEYWRWWVVHLWVEGVFEVFATAIVSALLPQGLWQTYVSFSDHYAAARSAEMMHHPIMEALVWARVPGDVVFAVGVGAFVLFFVQAFLSNGKRTAMG